MQIRYGQASYKRNMCWFREIFIKWHNKWIYMVMKSLISLNRSLRMWYQKSQDCHSKREHTLAKVYNALNTY